jgi:hypothetical protein
MVDVSLGTAKENTEQIIAIMSGLYKDEPGWGDDICNVLRGFTYMSTANGPLRYSTNYKDYNLD